MTTIHKFDYGSNAIILRVLFTDWEACTQQTDNGQNGMDHYEQFIKNSLET